MSSVEEVTSKDRPKHSLTKHLAMQQHRQSCEQSFLLHQSHLTSRLTEPMKFVLSTLWFPPNHSKLLESVRLPLHRLLEPEHFFGTLKTEFAHVQSFITREVAKTAMVQ